MDIHYTENTTDISYRTPRWLKLIRLFVFMVVFAAFTSGATALFLWNAIQPPENFPVGEKIVIEEGQTAQEVAAMFAELGLVKHDLALYSILVLLHDPTGIKASTYKFKEPMSALSIAERLVKGEFGIDLLRFVHYEGERNELLAERAAALLSEFDVAEFKEITKNKEGRMFPDTYLIPETYTATELATLLEDTFEARVAPLRPAIESSDYTEEEVLIIASLLEREANTRESKRIVAGIINNRLAENMPLQLDASIEYALDTPLHELGPGVLAQELRTNESPYNLYLNEGLPPTPIGNPGLTSIEAVLRPIESNYLFYLTGNNGVFYYAETGAQHNANVASYLQ